MKSLFTATAFSLTLALTSAHAGSLADPQVEPPIIVEEAASSSAGTLLPLFLLAIVAVAVGSSSGGGGATASDSRLKTDILQVGMTAQGLPLYHFRYIGGADVYEGVMAQDVAKIMPEAVHPFAFGYMAVDYGMLGLEMRKVN